MTIDKDHFLWVDYTNWKGRRAWRRVIPQGIECRVTPEHGEEPHWVMSVLMEDKGFARRTLAMTQIHQMKSGGPSPLSYGRPLP